MTYKGFKSTLSICEGITLTRRVTKEVTCMVSERSYSSNTPPLIKTLSHQIEAKRRSSRVSCYKSHGLENCPQEILTSYIP